MLDGRPVIAYEGESVAALLLAEGITATRMTRGGEPRGVYCGMGVCFDCLVVVDGVPEHAGMRHVGARRDERRASDRVRRAAGRRLMQMYVAGEWCEPPARRRS